MRFQEYLKVSASEINQELNEFFKRWIQEVNSISPNLSDMNNNFVRSSEGGKRIRGIFVKLGYELAGGKKTKEILKAAATYEVFQTAILAHDDIIDQSDTRRGKPTLYKSLGGDHYAVSQTICLGDIGFFLSYKVLSESDFPAELKNKAVTLFSNSILQTGLGEMLDVGLPVMEREKTEEGILKISSLKTAKYTLVGPLTLGATLAGADEKLLGKLEEFGESLGIAFQIQDDILGVFGDEKVLGKSVTSDIEEGKNTLMIIEALKKADQKQKKFLDKYYGKREIGQDELGRIRQIFIDTGALVYSQKYAEKLIKEAKKIIPVLTHNSELRILLTEMSDFLVKRNK